MGCNKLNNYYIKDIDKIIDDNIKLKTKGYGYLTVTERLSGGYCCVKFEDTGWVTNAKFDNILYGKVRDKMVRTAYGVGVIGGKYLGKLASIRYMEVGSKDKPRVPSFQGWRHEDDL